MHEASVPDLLGSFSSSGGKEKEMKSYNVNLKKIKLINYIKIIRYRHKIYHH